MIHRIKQLDAPFWAVLLVGIFSVGSLGCFGIAALSQAEPINDAEILDTNNFEPPTDL